MNLRERWRRLFDAHCAGCELPVSEVGNGFGCPRTSCPRWEAGLTFARPVVDPLDVARFWRAETQRALADAQAYREQRDSLARALVVSMRANTQAFALLAQEAAAACDAMTALSRVLPHVPPDLEVAEEARRVLDA